MQVGKKLSKQCPFCHKTARSSMKNLTTYWYCKHCQLGWLKEIPSISYSNDYYQSESQFLSQIFSSLIKLFYIIRSWYADNRQKKLWIDVGAGDGSFLQTVNARKKIGVETSKAGIQIMKQSGIATLTDKDFLKTKDLNASVVSFWHMLEHVSNPWEYLSTAKKNVNKKGQLVIGVPNNTSWELALFKNYWFHLAPSFHIFHFSPQSMTMLLNREGFSVQKIDYWSVEHALSGLLQSIINYTTKSQGVLHNLIKRNTYTNTLNWYQLVIIIFWCTLGLPFVILFWIISAIAHKSGTFVIVASLSSERG